MIIEESLKVGDKERQLWKMKRLMDLPPVELPYRCGRAVARSRRSEMGCDKRRVGPIQKPRRYSIVLRRHQQLPLVELRTRKIRPGISQKVAQDVRF